MNPKYPKYSKFDVILFSYLISADCGLLDFQDELSLSLKSLQDKLESLKRIHIMSADMFQYIKVTCDEMIFGFEF